MKRFFLLSLLISLIYVNANGQIQKGALLTGGSFSFSTQNNDNEYTTSGSFSVSESDNDFFALRPKIGVFVSESLLLGMGIQYEYQYIKSVNSLDGIQGNFFSVKSNLTLINPYAQKFYKLTDNFFFTPSLNILLGGGNRVQNGTSNNRESDTFTFRVNINPGLTYFISEKWAITTTFGELFYSRTKEETEPGPDDSGKQENIRQRYGFNLSFNSFGVGIQYYLRNKAG